MQHRSPIKSAVRLDVEPDDGSIGCNNHVGSDSGAYSDIRVITSTFLPSPLLPPRFLLKPTVQFTSFIAPYGTTALPPLLLTSALKQPPSLPNRSLMLH